MSRIGKLLIATILVLAALFGLGWLFQEQILLKGIQLAADRRTPVGPHEEVVWESGPDPAGRAPGERPPNIVLILADDLGWNDLRFMGGGVAGGSVPTPHIDSIAAEGVQFTQGYAGNATCAPSRANSKAVSRPTPLAAPVISATLSCSRISNASESGSKFWLRLPATNVRRPEARNRERSDWTRPSPGRTAQRGSNTDSCPDTVSRP